MAAFDEFNPSDVDEVVLLIKPILAGRHPAVIGAALADLLAILLAGHRGGDAEVLREHILAQHIEHVRMLIPVNEALDQSLH